MSLVFSSAPTQSGFTNASISSTNDKNASAIVRELLQNSYDAAIEDANKEKAIIKIIVEDVNIDKIPDLKNYKSVIEAISNENLSEQERDILNVIKEELAKETVSVLHIIDNGIGFNQKTLVAILSDGISEKSNPSDSGGAYGNGHFSAFNISDLRYILYGGKTSNLTHYCSGHALLRTHTIDESLKFGSGFLITEDKPIMEQNDIFLKDNEIPELVNKYLLKMDDTGGIVSILGFNFFGKDNKNIIDIISSSIVRNFFVAIKDKLLEVEISYQDSNIIIDSNSIEEVFEKTQNEKITPDYKTAKRFFDLLVYGTRGTISTLEGDIELYYSNSDTDTKLALCRNGMWINDAIPSPLNKAQFINNKPFSALVLPKRGSEISALIRRAEGNLHKDILLNRFSNDKNGKQKRKRLQDSLEETKNYFIDKIEKNDNDSFDVDIPELSITMIGDLKSKQPNKRKSTKTTKVPSKPKVAIGDGDIPIKKGGENGQGGGDKRPRPGNPFDVGKFSSRHNNKENRAYLRFSPEKKATNMLLCLRLEDGTDPTCDSYGYGERLKIKSALYNGNKCDIINEDTIDIGKIEKDELGKVEIEYETNLKGGYSIEYEFLNSAQKVEEKK